SSGFELIGDPRMESMNFAPASREVRATFAYRAQLAEHTHGALGLVYRINPNNTDLFGNERIAMFRLSHRLGI
ncbi:MAG: hypothetical protein FWC83_02240, partial [Alphaproteobacteria bacterium]|nr:hypothetical protein [Alphaproteobacteria bacterium]